jgi:hypothetical protein
VQGRGIWARHRPVFGHQQRSALPPPVGQPKITSLVNRHPVGQTAPDGFDRIVRSMAGSRNVLSPAEAWIAKGQRRPDRPIN